MNRKHIMHRKISLPSKKNEGPVWAEVKLKNRRIQMTKQKDGNYFVSVKSFQKDADRNIWHTYFILTEETIDYLGIMKNKLGGRE